MIYGSVHVFVSGPPPRVGIDRSIESTRAKGNLKNTISLFLVTGNSVKLETAHAHSFRVIFGSRRRECIIIIKKKILFKAVYDLDHRY
jgi:hypothetical protein